MTWFSQTLEIRGLMAGLVAGLLLTSAGCNSSSSPPPTPTPAPTAASTPTATKAPAEKKPKLEIEGGDTYDFGTTEVGQEFDHTFVVKNVSGADLKIMAGKPSCTTCTSFKLERGADGEFVTLKAGETIKALVTWHIKAKNPEFRQYAPLVLELPGGPPATGEEAQVKLYVVGKVVERIVISPLEWNLGDVVDGQPKEFKATVTSAVLDKFDLASVTNSRDVLKVTSAPLSPEMLKELGAKSGYELTAVLEPKIDIGDFNDRVKIKVMAPEEISLAAEVTARRPGPLKMFGQSFNADNMTLGLGTFNPKEGMTTRLHVFTRGVPAPLQVEKLDCKDPRFSVEIQPNTKVKSQEGDNRAYELIVKVAGSDRPVQYTPSEPLILGVVTNQPMIGTIQLKIRASAVN